MSANPLPEPERPKGWRPHRHNGWLRPAPTDPKWKAQADAANPIRAMIIDLYRLAKEHSVDVLHWDRSSENESAKATPNEADEPGGDAPVILDPASKEEKRHFHEIMDERLLRDRPLTTALMQLQYGRAMPENFQLLDELEEVITWHQKYSNLFEEEDSLPARLREAIDRAKQLKTPDGKPFFEAMQEVRGSLKLVDNGYGVMV